MRTFLIGIGGIVVLAALVFLVLGLTGPDSLTVQHRRFIAAEPPEVFKVVSNPESWPVLFRYRGDHEIVKVTEAKDKGGKQPEWVIHFKNGKTWREIITAYEPPHDIHFTGIDTPGVQDWQMHVLLEPGARGGTVATFRITFSPDGFVARAASQLGFQAQLRHAAIGFLDNVAKKLGVANETVDVYVARHMAEIRREAMLDGGTKDGGAKDAGTAADGATHSAAEGKTDGGTAAHAKAKAGAKVPPKKPHTPAKRAATP